VTLTLTAAAVAIGAAGASVVVGSRAGTAAATGRGVLASGACAAVASLAVAAAVAVDRLGAFGLMHFVYLVATVSLPLLGLGVLARSIRDRRSPGFGAVHARSFGVLLLIPGALGIYGTHVEPNRLRVDRIEVALDPARDGDDEVRIAVLADLQTNHVGDHERRAIDEVLAADPDVILLPGDLFQGTAAAFDRELPRLQAELGRLVAPHGVFFVRGDVDHGDFADRALAGTGVQILDGELAEVQVGDRRLVIGGHPLDYRGDAAARTRTEVVAAAGEGAVTILLAHRPDRAARLRPVGDDDGRSPPRRAWRPPRGGRQHDLRQRRCRPRAGRGPAGSALQPPVDRHPHAEGSIGLRVSSSQRRLRRAAASRREWARSVA